MLIAGVASAGDPRAAEALFQRAQALMKKPDATKDEIHQACEYFVESYRQDPAVNTLVASAACHEKEGKNATAWGEYKEVGAQPGGAAEYARQRAAELEKAGFFKLTVKVPREVKRLSFKIDDEQLSVPPDDFPMDPGSHELEVSAPGKKSYKRHFDLTERTSPLTINVPELEDVKEEPRPNPQPQPQIITRVVQVTEQDPGGPYRGWGLFSIIFGGLTIATGSVGGALAKATYDGSVKYCTVNDVCTKDGVEKRNTANSFASIATGVFIGGAVLVAFGVTLYIVAPKKRMAEVKAAIGPTGVLLEGTF